MEFAVGTVIGVVGLYSTCLQLMEQVETARGFTKDSEKLRVMFETEKLLYKKWGEKVGIGKPQHHRCLDDPSDEYEVVRDVLENLKLIWTDSDTLSTKYGLKVSVPPGPGNMVVIRSQHELSFRRKFVWASKDKKKFESLLGDVGAFIQKLYDLVALSDDGEYKMAEMDDKLNELKSYLEGIIPI